MSKKILERDVLVALISDKEKIPKVQDIIKPEHFGAPHLKWAYRKLLSYHERYKASPIFSYYKIELAKNKDIDEEEKERWVRLLRQIYRKVLDESTQEYAIDELKNFARRQEMAKILDRSADRLEQHDVEDAINQLHAAINLKIGDQEYKITDWIDGWEERQETRKERKETPEANRYVRSPWMSLNKVIGGIGPGESCALASLTNIGKSIGLMYWGRRAVLDGKNVCHVVIEDTEEMLLQRYDSSILEIPYDDLKWYDMTPTQLEILNNRVERVRKLMKNKLKIVKTMARRTTVLTIEKALRDLELEGFIPDFLIIDHAGIMIPIKKQEMHRLDQAEVYWDLKSFAEARRLPLLTADQVAKEYMRRKAYAEGLSESYDKARILNIVLTLNQLDPQSKDLVLMVAKNRDGEKNQEIPLVSNFGNMQFLEKS